MSKQWVRQFFLGACLLSALLLTACFPPKTEKPVQLVSIQYSNELASFLPKGPYVWRYNGFVDYLHEMKTVNIFENDSTLVYEIAGMVEDLSAGESGADFSTKTHYTVTQDSIVQEKKGIMLMDSDADRMTILKLPIKKGTTWNETVELANHKKMNLKSTITNIQNIEGKRVVTVAVKEEDGPYYELRKIKEGIGVIEFKKMMRLESESFEVSYHLDESVVTAPNAVVQNESSIPQSSVQIDPKIEQAILNFDYAWIEYVNTGKEDVYNYLVKEGSADRLIKTFRRDGSKQKFLEVKVNRVEILDNKATAWVKERILRTRNDESRELEYHWVYYLKKVDGKWLIDMYEKDQNIN